MTLLQSQRYADKIVEWLAPFCVRLWVVGSIRRQRPEVGDVDLLCIPKMVLHRDLLGEATTTGNAVRDELIRYVRASKTEVRGQKSEVRPAAEWNIDEPKPDAQNLLLQLPKCQLDVWCATESTWTTRMICRTGSTQHNIWLCSRAAKRNGHWQPYAGLRLNGKNIEAKDETEFYAALDLPFIAPKDREMTYLHKNFGK